MSAMFDLPDVPTTLMGFSSDAIIDFAQAYLDLLGQMNHVLKECDTEWAFFRFNGRGYTFTGHPPPDLVEKIRDAT